MVLLASDFDSLNNGNPFAPPTDPRPAPVYSIGSAAQITEFVHLYEDEKEKFITYCEFHIILISMITNKCPEKYTTTLKHRITKFFQCEPLTLLAHLYTEYGTITSSDLTMTANLFASATTMYIHSYFSTKHSKPGTKKQISIKHMQTFPYS